jgi:hypothetical protein
MNWRLILVLCAAAVAVMLIVRMVAESTQAADGEKAQVEDGKESDAPFAVVELFTSEGCSSCPAADALLAEVVQDAQKNGRRVFCLGFHVDYWNRLGWTDPYSTPGFSRRQQAYAEAMKLDQVYTPQMIVNGGEEFLGSDRRRSRTVIDAALKKPAKALVKLGEEKPSAPNSVAVSYAVTRAPARAVLNVAVVERGLSNEVKRGENSGRTLRHENAVRAFQTVRLDDAEKGSVELKVPADLVRKSASVIAYVQEADTRGILGATALALAPDGVGQR